MTAIDETLRFLESPEALAMLDANCYWPKWDAPWWRLTLLHEMGLAARIPRRTAEAMVRSLDRVLHFFPLSEAEVPEGKSGELDAACHCQVGNMYSTLIGCGIDVDRVLPWIRPWFLRYQLPDGGLNCDERVYRRPVPRSSFLSTLPCLEAMLAASAPLSEAEVAFLDRGARYLIERRLLRSLSKGGCVIDEGWLSLCFPRQYDYDVLRGLAWLVRWAERLGRDLPESAIAEAVASIERTGPVIGRRACPGARTRFRSSEGQWLEGEARPFPLLLEVASQPGVSPYLARQWAETREGLARLRAAGRLQ